MHRHPVRRVQVVILAVSFHLLAFAHFASAQSQSDRDLQAISAHQLTMPTYKKYLAAMVNLATAAQQNPKLASSMKESEGWSLDQAVKAYEGVPEIRGAISKAGLTPRDFLLTQYAMLQTGLAYGMMKEQKLSADSAATITKASRGNLSFFQQNEAEIQRLTKETEAKVPVIEQPAEDEAEDK